MGDVAMCVPAVWSLAQEYKNLEIVFLSRKNFAPMFSQMPDNVKFWGIDLKNDYKGISGLNHLFAEIKKQNFDAYADFHDVLRTKYLKFRASLSGIKTAKIDKGRRDKKRITRKGAINYKPLKTTSERYKNVLEKLGFEFEINFTSIYNKGFALPQEVAKICGEKTAKWIGIAPFAAHKGKILPLATTEKIVEILSDRETKVFLFGAGEKEKSILEEWQAKYKNVVSTAGKLGGLANELPLISQLDCMLSMDSANMHLA